MGRGINQFLRRNIAGEQSLKPVVRSYYAHPPELAADVINKSDAVTEYGSDDWMAEWLTPAPISPTEHKAGGQTPASEQDVQPDTRIHSSSPGVKERHASLTPPEGKEAAAHHNDLMGIQPPLKASGTGSVSGTHTEPPPMNGEMPEPAQNTAPPPFEPHTPPDKMNTHAKFWRGKATPVRTMAGESVITPAPSAKRRDFTEQVAASILGNENAYQGEQATPSPSGAALAAGDSSVSALSASALSLGEDQLDVKVSIHHVSIVPAATAPKTKNADWKPPVSLTDYLRERREGNR